MNLRSWISTAKWTWTSGTTTRSTTGTTNFKSRRRRASARRRAFRTSVCARRWNVASRSRWLVYRRMSAVCDDRRVNVRNRSSTGAAKPRCTNACTVRCPPSRRSSVAPPTRCGRERLRAGRRNRFASPGFVRRRFCARLAANSPIRRRWIDAACDTVWCRRRRTPRTPPRRGPKSTASTPCRRASMTRPVAVCR